ncbi:UNVERIFIED_CONTAM: hypothetical protein K2H54_074883 [Gekko kuhli]
MLSASPIILCSFVSGLGWRRAPKCDLDQKYTQYLMLNGVWGDGHLGKTICFHLNAFSGEKKEDKEMEFILESINLRSAPEVLLKVFRSSSGEALALAPEQVWQLPKA